jgi:short-subunit dehydrogenase
MAEKILITGAGTGLGEGTALGLAKAGHTVYATTQTQEQADKLQAKSDAMKVRLIVSKIDITDPIDVELLVAMDFNILVNNAAIGEGGPISEIPVDLLRHNFEVNVFSPLTLTQRVARKWVDNGIKGKIVFLSSLVGLISPPVIAPYAATKHAIEAIARAMSIELQPFGIQVQTILPGPYLTGFNEGMVEKAFRWLKDDKNFTKGETLRAMAKALIGHPEGRLNPDDMIAKMVEIVPARTGKYRNLFPPTLRSMVDADEAQAFAQDI